MKNWLRKWLGTSDLQDAIDNLTRHSINLQADIRSLDSRISILNGNVPVHNNAIARLIAKLDPLYGIPEDDPERKAASDKLSAQIINKLYADHAASNKLTGDYE